MRRWRLLAHDAWLAWLISNPRRAERYFSRRAAREGITRDQLLAVIYNDVPERLWPLIDQYRSARPG